MSTSNTSNKKYYTQPEVDHLTPDEEAEFAAMILIGKITEMPRHRGESQYWMVNPGGYMFTCRQNALEYSQTERTKYYRRNTSLKSQWEASGEVF